MPRENNKEMASLLSSTQPKQAPIGLQDPNAVSITSIEIPNSLLLA